MPTCLSCGFRGSDADLERVITFVGLHAVTVKRCPKCASELIDWGERARVDYEGGPECCADP